MKGPFWILVVLAVGVAAFICGGELGREDVASLSAENRKMRAQLEHLRERTDEATFPLKVRGMNQPIAREVMTRNRMRLEPSTPWQLVYREVPTPPGMGDFESVVPVVFFEQREDGEVWVEFNFQVPGKPGIEPRMRFAKGAGK